MSSLLRHGNTVCVDAVVTVLLLQRWLPPPLISVCVSQLLYVVVLLATTLTRLTITSFTPSLCVRIHERRHRDHAHRHE